jgi:hypothetical protein
MKRITLAVLTLALSAGCDRPKDVPSTTTTTTSSDYARDASTFVPSNSDTATMSSGGVPGTDPASPRSAGAYDAYDGGSHANDRTGSLYGDRGSYVNGMNGARYDAGSGRAIAPRRSSGTGTATGAGNATGAAGGT